MWVRARVVGQVFNLSGRDEILSYDDATLDAAPILTTVALHLRVATVTIYQIRCDALSHRPKPPQLRSLPVGQTRPNAKKWLAAGVKLLIVVLIVWFVRHTLITGLSQLDKHPWRFQPLWLAAAGGLYLLGLLPAGLFWRRVLRVLGQEARLGETLRAYYIGHLGKYVPGKAMVVVLRTGLIRSHRVETGVAAVSVFFETLTMMSVGAFIAAAILAGWFRQQASPLLFWVALGLMVAAGLPTLPPVFKRLVQLAGIGKSNPATAEKLQNLGYGTLLAGWVAMSIGWIILALSLWAVLRAMGVADVNPLVELPRYTAGVSLAMVAGFLSLVPGGAVVREVVLMALMVPYFSAALPEASDEKVAAAALVSAVALRIVWLVSELAISGILYVPYLASRKGRR